MVASAWFFLEQRWMEGLILASGRKQHHDAWKWLKKYRWVDSERMISPELNRMQFLRSRYVQIASISISALTQESDS
jgi:hypothetical protein